MGFRVSRRSDVQGDQLGTGSQFFELREVFGELVYDRPHS